jgi:hypothetical protein
MGIKLSKRKTKSKRGGFRYAKQIMKKRKRTLRSKERASKSRIKNRTVKKSNKKKKKRRR